MEGAVVHTRDTIKPCSRPLRDIEYHVAVQHKLIKSNFKSMRVVRVVLTMFFFFWGGGGFTILQSRKHVQCIVIQLVIGQYLQHYIVKLLDCFDKPHPFSVMFNLECPQISALLIKS